MSLKIYNDFKIYNINIMYADTLYHYTTTPPYKIVVNMWLKVNIFVELVV